MGSTSGPSPARSEDLEVTDDLPTSATRAKRMLEATGIDSPAKKRPKMTSSQEHDLTLDHLAAFLEDTRRTGQADLWYDAHQKLYDHLKERRAKMLENTSVDNKVDTPSQVTKHSDSDISENGGTHRNFFEVLLGRLETALEQHFRQHHDKNQPSAAEDPRSTTGSPPSNLPSPRTHKVPAPPPAKPSLSTRSSLRNKTIENSLAVNGSKADRPRSSRAKTYTPARRSRGSARGGSTSCCSTSTSRSATSEPKPEPEPSLSPSLKSNNSGRSNLRPKAVPGTKAERLAKCMKYWPRREEPEKDEEDHEDGAGETEA